MNILFIGLDGILRNKNLSFEQALKKTTNVIKVKPPKLKLENRFIISRWSINSFIDLSLKHKLFINKVCSSSPAKRHNSPSVKADKKLKSQQSYVNSTIKVWLDWSSIKIAI